MVQRISDGGVIAVLIVDKADHAIPLSEALQEGGVDTIELTLRTPESLKAAAIIKSSLPKINLGIGTVLTIDQLLAVYDVGVDFAVSPGCNPTVLEKAISLGLPFAPGIMTPSDIEVAISYGCRLLKFFPAETSGGLPHLTSMSAPYNHLGLKFIPLGGVNMSNAEKYLRSPLISAVGDHGLRSEI